MLQLPCTHVNTHLQTQTHKQRHKPHSIIVLSKNVYYDHLDTSPFNMITFGVELEFVLLYPHHELDDDYACELVRKALNRPISLPCTVTECPYDSHEYHLPLNSSPSTNYSYHRVTQDSSVSPDEDEEASIPMSYQFCGVEIVTRVMNFDEPTSFPNDIATRMVRLSRCPGKENYLSYSNS